MTTEEEDTMIEGRLMRGELSGEGQGHLVLEALVELEDVQEVQGTEDVQGHIVGRDPDLDQGHGANQGQGQDLGRGKVRLKKIGSKICIDCLFLVFVEKEMKRKYISQKRRICIIHSNF